MGTKTKTRRRTSKRGQKPPSVGLVRVKSQRRNTEIMLSFVRKNALRLMQVTAQKKSREHARLGARVVVRAFLTQRLSCHKILSVTKLKTKTKTRRRTSKRGQKPPSVGLVRVKSQIRNTEIMLSFV